VGADHNMKGHPERVLRGRRIVQNRLQFQEGFEPLPPIDGFLHQIVSSGAARQSVARTIADPTAAERLAAEPISEAIQFRSLDRQVWG